MNIQKFTKKDIIFCADLFAQVFSSEPWNEAWTVENASKRFFQFSELPNFIGFTCTYRGEVIGFIGGFYEFWCDGKIFLLEELFVKKDYQDQGIGTMLITYLLEILKQNNVKRVYLRTLGSSLQEKIYKKWGFTTNKSIVEMENNL